MLEPSWDCILLITFKPLEAVPSSEYCDRNSWAAYAQSFALWKQVTTEIMYRTLSYYCLLAPRIYIVILRAHFRSWWFRSWWITHSTQRQRRGCNSSMWTVECGNWRAHRAISIVACCHSVKLCAIAARAFRSQCYESRIRLFILCPKQNNLILESRTVQNSNPNMMPSLSSS